MPLIEYTTFDISPEEKHRLIKGMIQTAHEITGIPTQFFTMVIREVSGPDAWGANGQPLIDDPRYRPKIQ